MELPKWFLWELRNFLRMTPELQNREIQLIKPLGAAKESNFSVDPDLRSRRKYPSPRLKTYCWLPFPIRSISLELHKWHKWIGPVYLTRVLLWAKVSDSQAIHPPVKHKIPMFLGDLPFSKSFCLYPSPRVLLRLAPLAGFFVPRKKPTANYPNIQLLLLKNVVVICYNNGPMVPWIFLSHILYWLAYYVFV